MKGCEKGHYCCQVSLLFQGFDINLIYMKRQVQTPSIADAWLLLIACIPFYGMPFHVNQTFITFFKIINVGLLPGSEKPCHTRVGHPNTEPNRHRNNPALLPQSKISTLGLQLYPVCGCLNAIHARKYCISCKPAAPKEPFLHLHHLSNRTVQISRR